LIRVMGPQCGKTAYIAKVNRALNVKFDAQVATNENSDSV